MDMLESILSEGTAPQKQQPSQTAAKFDKAGAYGTPSALLDNLRHTESGGDEAAVNKQTKALGAYQFMPETVQMLHRQGVKFNPFDEKESRAAADYYVSTLAAKNNGDYSKAMAQYGGFKTADASGYVGKVLKGVDQSPRMREEQSSGGQPDMLESILSENAVQDSKNKTTAPPANTSQSEWESESPLPASRLLQKRIHTTQRVGDLLKGAASLADTTVGGVIPAVAGQVAYAGGRALGQTPEEAQSTSSNVSGALSNPFGRALGIENDAAYKNEGSRQAMQFIGDNIHKGAQWLSEKTGMPVSDVENITQSLTPAAGKVGANAIGSAKNALNAQFAERAAQKTNGIASGGAAATPLHEIASAEGASPEIVSSIKSAEQKGILNRTAAENHIAADSLPVPVKLTAGQATEDVNLLSQEKNARAKDPARAQLFNEQNKALKENINAIRDQAAPDVFDANHVEAGGSLIEAYKAKDAADREVISSAYKDLADANGGQLPIDGKAFVAHANAELGKQMKGAYLPKETQTIMNQILTGEQPMTMENFENLRTILGNDARKFERAGDGNAAHAVSIVRDALENMPLTEEASQLKPLADKARTLAKQRFDKLKSDPAYNAAVNDKIPKDDFIKKFVINGKKDHVAAMKDNLAGDEVAQQTISHGAINYLKSRAGIVNDEGNFSQAGYNKALESLRPKLDMLVDQKTASNLDKLGKTARLTQQQPTGSYVNNSNTFVNQISELGKTSVEMKANFMAGGLPVGTMVRQFAGRKAAAEEAKRFMQPGGGIEKGKK